MTSRAPSAAKSVLAAIALLVLLAAPAQPAAGPTVLFPPDMALFFEGKTRIYVFDPAAGPPIPVKVNGKAVASLEGGAFRIGEIEMAKGLNFVDVGEKSLRYFFQPGAKLDKFRLDLGTGKPAFEFQAYRLHPALPDGCDSCHVFEGGKLKAKDQKEACYACHDNFEKVEGNKSVHTPVKGGECTGCHDPHYSIRPKLQKLEKGCLECHDPPPAEGTVHPPVAEGACLSCHTPHVGEAPKQLVRPGNALCLGCHADSHFQHRSAKTKGTLTVVPEGFPKDKENLACLGCHQHHQSAERRLLRKPQGELCKSCHQV